MAKFKNYCSECGRVMNRYRRKVTLGMKSFLENLNEFNNKNPNSYCHYRDCITLKSGSLDYSLLSNFGLIEPKPNEAGFWRTSQKGKDFLSSKARIPRYLYFYLCKQVDESKELISIDQIVKKRFKLKDIKRNGENPSL